MASQADPFGLVSAPRSWTFSMNSCYCSTDSIFQFGNGGTLKTETWLRQFCWGEFISKSWYSRNTRTAKGIGVLKILYQKKDRRPKSSVFVSMFTENKANSFVVQQFVAWSSIQLFDPEKEQGRVLGETVHCRK